MKQHHIKQRLLTIKEASVFLGRSPYSVRSLIWNGLIPVIQLPGGRKQWVDLDDLNAFVEKNKIVKQ